MKIVQSVYLIGTLLFTANAQGSQTLQDLTKKAQNWFTSVSTQVSDQVHHFFQHAEDTKKAAEIIVEKPNASTPTIAKVKEYITTLSADSADAQFNCAQDALTGLRLRSQENLYTQWEKSYASGFRKTDVTDPKGAYEYLGIKCTSKWKTTKDMMNIINRQILWNERYPIDNRATLVTLRELGNIFRCPVNKQNYDAFLKGAEAVEELHITEQQKTTILAMQELLQEKKCAQEEKRLAART